MKDSQQVVNTEADGITFLCLEKGQERYVIFYEDFWTGEAYRTVARWAANQELSFTWLDAAKLGKQIRDNAREQGAMNNEVQQPAIGITPARQRLALMLCDLRHRKRRRVEYEGLEADIEQWVSQYGEPTDELVAAWAKEQGL